MANLPELTPEAFIQIVSEQTKAAVEFADLFDDPGFSAFAREKAAELAEFERRLAEGQL